MSISRITGQLCTTTTAARQTSDLPDAALIRSIAAGNKHAMQILFARHNVRVFRFLVRFGGQLGCGGSGQRGVLGRLAAGRRISGSIPGYHLASRDCPQ